MRLDPNNPPQTVQFKGVTYRLMGGRRKYYLSQSTTNAGRKNPKGLHVAIWEDATGKTVPPNHEINHKDSDTFNCEPDNLECLPKGVHRALPKRYADFGAQLEHLEDIRPLAAKWHRSKAGREWHRKHAEESFRAPGAAKPYSKVIPQKRICAWCGTEFLFRHHKAKFCCTRCVTQESGYRRGKYKFVHPYYAARLQSDGG